MYAFVRFGNTEVKVAEGDLVEVFPISGKVGDKVDLQPTGFFDGKEMITEPKKLAKVKVRCEILKEKRGKKIYVFKKKRKTGYKRGIGHRDHLMVIKVEKITG